MSVGFYVYPRKRKTRKPLYYAKFRVDSGDWTSPVSTGETSKSAAELWAQEQIDAGKVSQPAGPEPTVSRWAEGFFGVGGRYDQAKRARGRELSATYLENLRRSFEKYVEPVFGRRKLSEIRALDLEQFFLDLYNREKPKLSGSTVNGVLRSVRALFAEAERLEVIRSNPAAKVQRFAERPRERGALTQDELDKLFAVDALDRVWNGKRPGMLIAMTAAGCGLRHGEIVALRPCDFAGSIVLVQRSWDRVAGVFKHPKWHSEREAPVPPRLTAELSEYVEDEGIASDGLLFPSAVPSIPIEPHGVTDPLKDALEAIGIPRSEQAKDRRFLDLHSLRHTFITRLRAGEVPDWQIQRAAGHRSVAMTNHYTHARGEDLGAVASVSILPFKKAANS